MGRITLTEIEKGDACDLTVTNPMMFAISTGVVGIDDQNVRRGGLDERNFEDDAVTQKPTGAKIFHTSTGTSINNSSAPTSPVLVGAVPVATGPYRHQPTTHGDRLLVKISLQFEDQAKASGTMFQLNCQLAYSTDWDGTGNGATTAGGASVTWTPIDATLRKVGVYGLRTKGSMTIAHHFVSAAGDSVYFGLLVWDAASFPPNTVTIEEINFYAISYTR